MSPSLTETTAMTKLTDTQTIVLSAASQREGGSLYPLPTTLTAPKPAIAKSVAALITRGLAEERETNDPATSARSDGDLRYGVFITPAGLTAIGAGEGDPEPLPVVAPAPAPISKSAAVIALLQRATGATLPELIEATGWLPHTTRAALTGLRKKGHVLDKSQRDGATCYRIASAT